MNDQDAEYMQMLLKKLISDREARMNELAPDQWITDTRLTVIDAQIKELQEVLDTFDDWFDI
jgi:hypothetical protein